MSNRYFYHSFPRQSRNRPFVDGLKVLKSICDFGLILTPETMPFEIGQEAPLRVLQRRFCLTELDQSELEAHAKDFGEFALEFTIEATKSLGAVPAFYLPSNSGTDSDLGLAGGKLALYLAQAHEFLNRIDDHQQSNPGSSFAQAVKDLRSERCGGAIAEVSQFKFAVEAVMNLAIPTENLSYVGELGYYRQREWRITYSFLEDGVCPASYLSSEAKDALIGINGWFAETLRNGKGRVVDWCLHIPSVGQKKTIEHVRRILVPSTLVDAAQAIVRAAGVSVPVEAVPT